MNIALRFLLALLFFPRLAAAQLLSPSLDGVRLLPGVSSDSSVQLVPVKFKTEKNPQYVDPRKRPPPNLDQGKVDVLIERLNDLAKQQGASGPGFFKRMRLRKGLNVVGQQFVDPVSKDQWGNILSAMEETAKKSIGMGKPDWDKVIDEMLQSGVGELKDPHSVYMNPGEVKRLEEELQGSFSGIGATLSAKPEGAQVEMVIPNSPAAKARLRIGDLITEVNGMPVAGESLEEITKGIRGKKGTQVELQITRDGQALAPIKMTRDKVDVPDVGARMLTDTIGYIYLAEFREDSDERLFKAVKGLKARGMTSLVLDVRGNPGGMIDIVSSIASEFLKDGQKIVTLKRQGQWVKRAITNGDGMFVGIPTVVLVNGDSASASEVLAASFQDHGQAPVVIGSRSYGKGTAQILEPLGRKRAVMITSERWYTPKDRSIDARHDPATGEEIPGTGGVLPDPGMNVPVPKEQEMKILQEIYRHDLYKVPPTGPRTEDPALKKAIEVLQARSAS